jgi:hypothetical protein
MSNEKVNDIINNKTKPITVGDELVGIFLSVDDFKQLLEFLGEQ